MPVTVQRVVECAREAEKSPERLVLIVGKPGSGKSKIMRELSAMRGWQYVDCRSLITDEILELVPKARATETPVAMGKALGELQADVVLLDSTQILFAPVLHLDPLATLRQLSRKHTIVAAWPGDYREGKLSYFRYGSQVPALYDAKDIKIICIE